MLPSQQVTMPGVGQIYQKVPLELVRVSSPHHCRLCALLPLLEASLSLNLWEPLPLESLMLSIALPFLSSSLRLPLPQGYNENSA